MKENAKNGQWLEIIDQGFDVYICFSCPLACIEMPYFFGRTFIASCGVEGLGNQIVLQLFDSESFTICQGKRQFITM